MAHHRKDFATNRETLRIIVIAAVIGLCSTLAAFILLRLIRLFTNVFFYQTPSFAIHSPADHTLGMWVIVLPVIGGLIIGLMARFGSDKIRGHGIPEAIEAILFRKSAIPPRIAILKPLSSAIAIGSGGPFGAEGPIIMTGGAIGSVIAQYFHLTAAERKTLLVAGAAAGMTAVFGTPLAAVILAVELLLFEWRPRSLLPVAFACSMAGFARPFLLDTGPLFPLDTAPPSFSAMASCLVTGLLCGALAAALSAALYKVEDIFAKSPFHWMWWPALGGLAVGIGGYFQPAALGIGYDVIADLLNNRLLPTVVLGLLLVKAAIWVIALGSGTSGGVLAPILMLGAGLGALLSTILPGAEAALWPLVCMSGVLSGLLGAPLTAIVFALELTHDANALLPLLLTTVIAHGFTALTTRRSIMTEKIARRGLHTYREYGVDPLERLHVEDLMTRNARTIDATTSIALVFTNYFGLPQTHRAYPVVKTDGTLVGVLDRATLLEQLGKHPDTAAVSDLFDADAPVAVALPGETCRTVASRMAVGEVERLPVVADLVSNRLVGIISRSDLVKPGREVFEVEEKRERLLIWSKKNR